MYSLKEYFAWCEIKNKLIECVILFSIYHKVLRFESKKVSLKKEQERKQMESLDPQKRIKIVKLFFSSSASSSSSSSCIFLNALSTLSPERVSFKDVYSLYHMRALNEAKQTTKIVKPKYHGKTMHGLYWHSFTFNL